MKKIMFKTLSILLAAVLLVAALPIALFAEDVSHCAAVPCDHNIEIFSQETYVSYSIDYHLTTLYNVCYCSLCELVLDVAVIKRYYESHNVEESRDKTYSPDSDAYHLTTEHVYETCICCGIEINSYEIDSNETHVFEASVDPEVDMEGVCIYCGETIYW